MTTLVFDNSKEAKFRLDISVETRVLNVEIDTREANELGKLYRLNKELNSRVNVDKNQFITHENRLESE